MRADRLVALVLLLRRRGRLSATELAEELEVSARTVLRDIDALTVAGVPVYAERGRHGGFELLPGFETELTGLNHEESLALLTAGSRRGNQAFGLGSALATAMLKVFDALPDDLRDTAAAAADRLLIDPDVDALSRPIAPQEIAPSILSPIRQAVLRGRKLRILYAAPDKPAEWRTVDPIGLVAVRERVYLLARRSGEHRSYRLSRMTSAEELDEAADRPDSVDLEQEWRERGRALQASSDRVTVKLRVSPQERSTVATAAVSTAAVTTAAVTTREQNTGADGWSEVEAVFRDAQHAEWTLWKLGTDAEALEPSWLRDRLRERAGSMAAQYGSEG